MKTIIRLAAASFIAAFACVCVGAPQPNYQRNYVTTNQITTVPSPNDVLTWDNGLGHPVWAAPPGATGGEANTASSLGGGAQLTAGKTGVDLKYNTITNLDGTIVVSSNAPNQIVISAASGQATDAEVAAGYQPLDPTLTAASTNGFDGFGLILCSTGSGQLLTLDASGFDGNLAATDDTLQEVAQKLDDLTAVGGSGDFMADASVPLTASPKLVTTTANAQTTNGFKRAIDVTHFGAVGNGSTDDAAAVQAAVDYAETNGMGGTVYYPKGVYRQDKAIVVPAYVKIEGENTGTWSSVTNGVTIKGGANRAVFIVNGRRVGIRQLNMDASDAAGSYGIMTTNAVSTPDCEFDHLIINNMAGACIRLHTNWVTTITKCELVSSAIGIDMTNNVNSVSVRDSKISGNTVGVWIRGGSTYANHFENNTVEANTTGFKTESTVFATTFKGNHCESNTVDVDSDGSYGLTISGNLFNRPAASPYSVWITNCSTPTINWNTFNNDRGTNIVVNSTTTGTTILNNYMVLGSAFVQEIVNATNYTMLKNGTLDLGGGNVTNIGTMTVSGITTTTLTKSGETVDKMVWADSDGANAQFSTAAAGSAVISAVLNDETGSGPAVFAVSPALTGNPTAPTQSAGDNSTKIATTEYADRAAGSAGTAVYTADTTDATSVPIYTNSPAANTSFRLSATVLGGGPTNTASYTITTSGTRYGGAPALKSEADAFSEQVGSNAAADAQLDTNALWQISGNNVVLSVWGVANGEELTHWIATDLKIISTTNAPSSDTTAPTLSSATIGTDGTTWTLVFSEPVSIGAGGNGGWTVTMSTAGAVTLTYSSGSGTGTLVYTGTPTVVASETATAGLDYTQPGNGIEDVAGNDLATINDAAVTNNSEQSGGPTGFLYEGMEGTGYEDNSPAWAETGTVDEDATADGAAEGSQYVRLDASSVAANLKKDYAVTATTNKWCYGAFRVSSLAASRIVVAVQDSGGSTLGYGYVTGGNIGVHHGTSDNPDPMASISTGTWWYYRFYYQSGTGANGVATLTVSPTTDMAHVNAVTVTLSNGTATGSVDKMQHGSGSTTGYTFDHDRIIYSDEDLGDDPAWQ